MECWYKKQVQPSGLEWGRIPRAASKMIGEASTRLPPRAERTRPLWELPSLDEGKRFIPSRPLPASMCREGACPLPPGGHGRARSPIPHRRARHRRAAGDKPLPYGTGDRADEPSALPAGRQGKPSCPYGTRAGAATQPSGSRSDCAPGRSPRPPGCRPPAVVPWTGRE